MPDVAAHLREQDVIWVDRGSVVNLLAVWRVHGLPDILAECWRAGIVLAGESAGSLCWHTCTITDSYGGIRGTGDGLAFLPYANAVHYGEGGRRAAFRQLIAAHDTDGGRVGYATATPAPDCTTWARSWWRRSPTGRTRAPTASPGPRTVGCGRSRWR